MIIEISKVETAFLHKKVQREPLEIKKREPPVSQNMSKDEMIDGGRKKDRDVGGMCGKITAPARHKDGQAMGRWKDR
jgi:hypothetical protein|uniref:Uncharacterized protein n=1 Tax=Picea glauca TaxID=3330 RepID=A0A117NIT7_PICGL|nr:hypothetical protein ABT39_MTgene324 [Picea glauca]QHR90678.1 hypothetical protein Q903MT_gene4703 [Picea sitchensis]